ncbi:hypothetical protein BH11PLA1_BH11PLA1_15310 [soil metagenome]
MKNTMPNFLSRAMATILSIPRRAACAAFLLVAVTLPLAARTPAPTAPAPALSAPNPAAPALSVSSKPANSSDTTKPEDRWYVVTLGGKRIGFAHSTLKIKNDRVLWRDDMSMRIQRGIIDLAVKVSSEGEETAAGAPIRMKSTQSMAGMPTTVETIFAKDKIKIIRGQTGAPQITEIDIPAQPWFTPRSAERELARRMALGAKQIILRVVDPSVADKPMTITYTVLEHAVTQALGRDVPAVKVSMTVDAMPNITATQYLAEDGSAIRTTMQLGEIAVEQVLADKALATSKVEPVELMVSTLVKPDLVIDHPRDVKRAVYVLKFKDADKVSESPDIESGAGQTVLRLSNRTSSVTVDPAAAPAVTLTTEERAGALAASTMLRHDDAKVMELIARADQPKATLPERAEALRTFVRKFIKQKDLSVGFATASETARTATGDCTEHAVLLAAMLRGIHIPSRVVSGLVYAEGFAGAENIFGYHCWAQALLPDAAGAERWVNLDAALTDSPVFDATHIMIQSSLMRDGEMDNLMLKAVPLLGRLTIHVESIK